MESPNLLTMGKISGVHGLAGNLKVWSFAESVDTFEKGRTILIRKENEPDGSGISHTIQSVSPWKKGVLLKLKDITDRNGAEDLVGRLILMDKTELPELEEDTWYWQDLLGLRVVDEERGDLGSVEDIFPTGANDVLVVKQGKNETLIPMHREFIMDVNLDKGVIETRLPEGL